MIFFSIFHYHQQNASSKRYKYGLTKASTIPPSLHNMFISIRIFNVIFGLSVGPWSKAGQIWTFININSCIMTITMSLMVIAGDDKYASAGLTHSSIVASADHGAWPLQNERPYQQTCTVLNLRVGCDGQSARKLVLVHIGN